MKWKNLFIQNHRANFNQTWHNASLGERVLMKGPALSIRENIMEWRKNTLMNLKLFFSRTTELISTKLGTKHPWMKGIQVCSNEGLCPFPRGDNYKIAKIYCRIFLKNLVLQNHWAIFNQTWLKASLGEGDSSLFKWRTI